MVRKLWFGAGVCVVILPIVLGTFVLIQTNRAMIHETQRLANERAVGIAANASATLDTVFMRLDSIITASADGSIDTSALAASHASISSAAVFDENGSLISRWPSGPAASLALPPGDDVKYLGRGRLLRTYKTSDGRTVAIVISVEKLEGVMSLEADSSLGEYRAADDRSYRSSWRLANYPLFATAKVKRPKDLASPGASSAMGLLAAAAYLLLVRSALRRWRKDKDAMAERNEALESELREFRSSFLTSVAKELLRPLGNVLGLTGTLAGRWEDLCEDKKRLLVDRIGANAEAMDEMVEEMMDFARIEQGTHKLFPRVCSLRMESVAVLDKLKPALSHHRTVSMVPEDLSAVADSRALRRILEILLSNAVRFSPQGSLIMLRAHRSGDDVVVSVDDEGPCVPATEASRIFDRFHRRDEERSGPGVGLWIAQEFVRSMGGEIRMESSERGSTFSFTLPATLRPYVTLPPDNVLVGHQLP